MVRASARVFAGTRYVIAVNAGTAAVRVSLDGVEVTLPPLGVRLLVGDERTLRLG
jgi:dTDP-4-amino-4,6-dideoxygalactose transaminase